MRVEIEKAGEFDPDADLATKWVWINSSGDGGSVVVFADRVLHLCAEASSPTTLDVENTQNCPNGCGTRFYPNAWARTREIHGI